MQKARPIQRDIKRIIIHFDYDCFYAAVVENENPALKSVPLAIQQKQIVVTCNYEARRRGLHKLQLITEAKKVCPDAVIILGEDLTRFRNASKELYAFLVSSIWSNRAERLGFDEVWLDCTDMIDYNYGLLNFNALANSFFCLDKDDPTLGFPFDASSIYGPTYPATSPTQAQSVAKLTGAKLETHLRLVLASHLARHLRHELERQKAYTATVGVAVNKILSKLIGNVNKPKNQTTLLAYHGYVDEADDPAITFMDSHDVGKVPGIGFKLAQKIRAKVLGRAASFDPGLVYGGTKEHVTVRDVRTFSNMGSDVLEEVLGGPGTPKGIGGKVWALLHGVDDTEVGKTKRVPSQISQEDSYMKYLHTYDQVRHQLVLLSNRLIQRMRLDLTEADDFDTETDQRWMAHPRTLRLSTRPRPPRNEDGTQSRTFHRISRSGPMPTFVLSLTESTAQLAERLVEEALGPMFRKLHPQRIGWNLSLINIAVTNMAETGTDSKDGQGRDIGRMFRQQEDVLRDFKVTNFGTDDDLDHDHDTHDDAAPHVELQTGGAAAAMTEEQNEHWDSDGESDMDARTCHICQTSVPLFALDAHQRYHALAD